MALKKIILLNTCDLSNSRHRINIENCPYCKTFTDGLSWLNKHLSAIVLIPPEHYQKENDLILISTCPVCLKRSWVHDSFMYTKWYLEDYGRNDLIKKIELFEKGA